MQQLIRLIAITALIGSSLAVAPVVDAGPKACGKRVNDTASKLAECVTLSAVRKHQEALQDFADDNEGNRAAGTIALDESVEYVAGKLRAAGYLVTLQEFPFTYLAPAELERILPTPATFDTTRFSGTGFGNVSAPVVPIDINLTMPRDNTSGCEPADFAGFAPGSIALLQRGTCFFFDKVENAMAAGAGAVIMFNDGSAPDREGLLSGTLGIGNTSSIPVVGASFADGATLAEPGTLARVHVAPPVDAPQVNILAESRYGNPDSVVMAGAHIDSVQRGPGINDNGSGSAALLEVAIQMAKVKPVDKVRFAWWGAEESGLVGSSAYVDALTEEDLGRIELYLNFDVIGSPNHVFFVFDGDDSDAEGAGAGPWGSGHIEEVFQDFYAARGESSKGADFNGFSDYGPFVEAGIAAGGVFSGAFGSKTPEEVAIWGGTEGEPYDPCFHIACDTYDVNGNHALDVNADAIAYAVIRFAMGVEAILPPAP